MKRSWFKVSETEAKRMAALGFKIKQTATGWMVLCYHGQLFQGAK